MENNTKCCGSDCGDNCDSESCCNEPCCGQKKISGCGACQGGIYGLAFLGAVIYYIQHAETFWMGVLGILKALVWPAVLIYKILELLAK